LVKTIFRQISTGCEGKRLPASMRAKRDRPPHRKGMAHPAFTVKMAP
jgi:hypothetical protein